MSKYHAKKTLAADGTLHDSKKEAQKWEEFCLMQESGEISDLRRQVKFVIIPKMLYIDASGKKRTSRECSYVADFVFRDKDGKQRIIDAKGYRTEVYKIKKKLMLQLGYVIEEV